MNKKLFNLKIAAVCVFLLSFAFSAQAAGQADFLDLAQGWNLVSSPFEQPLNLQDISKQCPLKARDGKIWSWAYNPATGWSQPQRLEKNKGVYIFSTQNCRAIIVGTPAVPSALTLKSGWNIFSADKPFEDIRGGCQIAANAKIWALRPGGNRGWEMLPLTDALSPKRGYWVQVIESCIAQVPAPPPPPPTEDVDFDVTYISRTPRYPRYKVCYNPGLSLCDGQKPTTDKRWPTAGDAVTFTAHVKTRGKPTAPLDYEWRIDGKTIGGGTIKNLSSGEITRSYTWAWKTGSHLVEFLIDPGNKIAEVSENNNKLTTNSDALTFRMHVENSVYNKFNSLKNLAGSYSFEDWLQAQIQEMRNLFSKAGIKEKITIDDIVIEPDGTLDRGSTHAPEDLLWDGRWGFQTDEWPANSIEFWATKIQGGLLHELSHQLGVIDAYRLNFDWNYANYNEVVPECADFVLGVSDSREYKDCAYYNPNLAGLMTDHMGDRSYSGPGYSPFDAGQLNSNLGKRRGYYGESLWDIPTKNTIRVLDKNGNTLKNAEVYFYQMEPNTKYPNKNGEIEGSMIQSRVKFSGRTDDVGHMDLPNIMTPLYPTTETGHTLVPNPFGAIDVTGQNSVFLVKIIYTKTWNFPLISSIPRTTSFDYQWMDISMFNAAYRSGTTKQALYTIKTDI